LGIEGAVPLVGPAGDMRSVATEGRLSWIPYSAPRWPHPHFNVPAAHAPRSGSVGYPNGRSPGCGL